MGELPNLRAALRELRRLAEELRELHPEPETPTGYVAGRLKRQIDRLADAVGEGG